MAVYEFDVAVTTHELLIEGVLADHYVWVEVEAPSRLEGSLIALQMANIVGYTTDILDRI